jgi:SpoVK/Ycf46/Vps4 family AAA+-type ATPase
MDNLLQDALETRFPAALAAVPYADESAYIRELLSLVSLCLVSAVACKAAASDAQSEETHGLPGGGMGLAEAERYVGDYPLSIIQPGNELAEFVALARARIASRLAATKREGIVLHLERLRELLGLSDFGFFCLCCALSAALDRGFERLFMALHDDGELPFPTLGAVRDCYYLAHPWQPDAWQELQNPASPANRLLFTPAPTDKPPLLRPVALRPGVLGYILHQPHRSRELAACSDRIEPSSTQPLYLDDQIRRVRSELEEIRRREESRLCILCGAAGSGKKLTLATIAGEGRDFLLVRLDDAPSFFDEMIDELVAAALLWDYTLCLSLKNPVGNPLPGKILKALAPYRIGAVLLAEQPGNVLTPDGTLVSRIEYATPDLAQSLAFWQLFAAAYTVGADVDPARLASKYTLTPGKIKAALRVAAEMAKSAGTPIAPAHIDAAILLGNTGRLSEIADKISVSYTWDDLVLGDASKQMMRDVCNRIKYRHQVETQWGFGGKSAYGNGISILLYGPPGTGKTMSAQVIAGELGLPLYRINLAQIISKYIGETAKNLDAVFTEAKSSNVILFFDEADALFAKRTDVKNSNDRHANSESSYLLQKIEEYSGISILATNLANNFDEAFRRRIGYMISIHMPSPAQRLELWRNYIPPQAPLSSDVDLQMLADNLEFSGSVIKSAALQAAYFAADEQTKIGMAHIARAIRRELQKLGKSEPHFLTLYPEKGT